MSINSQDEREIDVLLVDDEKNLLDQAEIFIKKENDSIQLKTVKSPKKALKLLNNNQYDCIVSDYQMPKINGLDFLKTIREERNKDIPFIMFTGKGREEVAIEALNLGADRYLQKGGDPRSLYGVLTQAIKQETKHRKAEEEVRKSEKKYRRLVETTGDLIFTHDKNGNIEFVNQAGLEFSGYTEEEVKNKNITDFLPKDEIPALIERSKKRIEEGNRETFKFETAFINKDGKRRDVDIEATPLFEDGEFKRELVVARDITERKKTENKLKESKEKYRTLTSEAPVGILTCDEEGEIGYVNDRMLEILGSPGEEKTKEINLVDFSLLEENGFSDALRRCLDTGETKKIEMKYESKWGKQVWMKTIISPLKKDGSIIGAQIIGEDISDRKKTEEKQKLLLENMEDHVWYLKDSETYGKANQVHADFFGLDKEEIENMNLYDVTRTEEEAEICIEGNKEVFNKKETIRTEEWIKNGKGEKRLLSITKTPKIENGEVQYVVCSGRDITEGKEKEKKLEKSEKRLKAMLSNTPAVIYSYEVIDGTPETTFVSESVKDVLGHKPEYYTSDPENFLNNLHPEDKEELFKKEEKLLTDEDTNRISAEYRFKNKKGKYLWLHDEQQVKTNENGTQEVIGAWWDITKQKKAEEREEFLHSLLRHDVENKTQIVQGYLELLNECDLSEEAEKYVKKAEKGLKDNNKLLGKVKTLKSIDEEDKISEINIDPKIKEVINERESQAREKAMKIEYEEINTKVVGGSLLEELFSNLIENSIEHSGGTKIRITSQEKENKCIITIEDDGKGIPDKEKPKIFKRGYKTGGTGGTGLGTHLAKEITENYNGDIEVKDSELGGAKFNVYLEKIKD